MPENPTTTGPEKSLRQAAPAGDIVAAVFALIAAYILFALLVNRPDNPIAILTGLFFIVVFAAPAYVVWASARQTGVFISDERVEYRLLGSPRQSWPRADVKEIQAMSGGMRIVGQDGQALRELRFRWWRTEQVAGFARAAGLAPSPAGIPVATATAQAGAWRTAPDGPASADVDPGKAGDGREEQQDGQEDHAADG